MEINHPFKGYALNAVDAKGRVSVPAPFRDLIATRCRLYAPGEEGIDGQLQIGLHEDMDRLQAFDAIAERQLNRDLREGVADLPAAQRREALAEKGGSELGGTTLVSFDSAGRLVLPPMWREFAGIGEVALFWGMMDYFVIWDPLKALAAFSGNRRNQMIVEYLLRERGIAAA